MIVQRLPLEKYAGHDIVLWGERGRVEAGDIQGTPLLQVRQLLDL